MSSASVSTLSFSLPLPMGMIDSPAIERDRRDRRVEDWASTLSPSHSLEHWLVGRAASASLDLERLEQAEAEARQNQSIRGSHCWEIDRRIDVEELAIKLGKTPGVVSRKLEGSKQGAEWLLERWVWLLRTLDEGADWNDSQRTLALDLLGIPDAERDGLTPIDPPPTAVSIESPRGAPSPRFSPALSPRRLPARSESPIIRSVARPVSGWLRRVPARRSRRSAERSPPRPASFAGLSTPSTKPATKMSPTSKPRPVQTQAPKPRPIQVTTPRNETNPNRHQRRAHRPCPSPRPRS